MKLITLASLAISLYTTVSFAHFMQTCTIIKSHETSIYAKCETFEKANRITKVDLNNCLANDNGRLVSRNDGNFLKTCKSFEIKGTIVEADCWNINGSLGKSSFDLRTWGAIHNENGWMRCHHHHGVEVRQHDNIVRLRQDWLPVENIEPIPWYDSLVWARLDL
ncbi:hypothetical protein BJ508DRAFT_365608 [Ascobolus immersus RN42]|uniref:Cyanovirin-N domain-containing protein n=1 Tax=Ascobolus immersus RN42 TaxID=1160509 RepID=A0A3N4I0U7_ASCIM|nr:hypothetical protein BJ508DRAFT_365608 [Ascobolus immersus RN42]